MPKTKFKKKVYKKKSYKKKSGGKSQMTVNLVRSLGPPVAPRCLAKLRYTELVTLADAVGGVAKNYQFNLNSIYDPNYTGTGHQPYGRDTFATLYNKYRVYKCAWTVHVRNNNTDLTTVVVPTNHDPGAIYAVAALELPRSKSSFNVINSQGAHIKGSISLANLHGNTPAEYRSNEACSAAIGANPTEVMLLNVVVSANDQASTFTSSVLVDLYYWVEFFDPLILAAS